MPSHHCERAIEDALRCGKAILKYISPNDVDLTGGHQYGFLLPKPVWHIYTPDEPKKGVNYTRPVRVLWQDGCVTTSNVKWYGDKSRSEFRITGFGRDFPFRTFDDVGNMLVLIPESYDSFIAYVLYSEEDFDEIQLALGVEIVKTWTAYEQGSALVEDENECISRLLRQYAGALNAFPSGAVCSAEARKALEQCSNNFRRLSADDILMKSYDTEHQLFRLIERQVCQQQIMRVFKDIDDFLSTAQSILQRRKSRAGRALENHVEYVLKDAGIPHKRQPKIDGEPDVVIPGEREYYDSSFPRDRLFIIGIKTTCKDRWRQVLNEAKQVNEKHILTLQSGISGKQLDQMHQSNVKLIVPKSLHREYPKNSNITLYTVDDFLKIVRETLNL